MAENEGFHNKDLKESAARLLVGSTYRDLSTICVMPIKSSFIDHRIAQGVENLIKPMNNPFTKWVMSGMEVGDAYNQAIKMILANPELSKWKFMLTVEHDNLPPPDGLVRLQKAMYNGPWAAVSGLYWTKGFEGQPMIYGHPQVFPPNFIPQIPVPETVQECRGIGMGFALWDLNLFKDPRLTDPWFETKNEYNPLTGQVSVGTQDLVFNGKAIGLGYRFAVDTSVKVGHMDLNTGFIW